MTTPLKYDHSVIAKGTNAARSILRDFENNGHVKISLAQFRDEILPHLADPDNHDVEYWLRYVKHPTAEMHVMDVDNVTVKYVVPALVGRLGATVPRVGEKALAGKMDDAFKRIERSPRSQDVELNKTLNPHINIPKGIVAARVKLNNILVAEGYSPLPIPGAPKGYTGVTQQGTANQPQGTKIEYEDEYEDL